MPWYLAVIHPSPLKWFFFNFYLFYLWLCWVFIAAHGLSLVAVSWPYSLDAALGPSCSTTCGVFPEPWSNPCPLHWQEDHQASAWNALAVMDLFLLWWTLTSKSPFTPLPPTQVSTQSIAPNGSWPQWARWNPQPLTLLRRVLKGLTGWGAHPTVNLQPVRFHRRKWKCLSLSRGRLFATPCTTACQAPLSTEFSISFSGGSSGPREWTWVSPYCRQILYHLSLQGKLLHPGDRVN